MHNLPGVGKNFHDHVQFLLTLTIDEKEQNALNWVSAMDYLLYRKGPLSSTGEYKIFLTL